MKTIFLILSLFFPLLSLSGEDKVTSLSLQAEALAEAHDYAAAGQLYEKLLTLPLPDWQKGRILYNLGTIRLAQQNPIEALALFQKVNPVDLSLPRFGRNLFLNAGIAYLQYAQSLAHDSPSSLGQQSIFIEQSLKAFDQAQQLDCQAQKEELSSSCISSILLSQWIETARLQFNQVMADSHQFHSLFKTEDSTPAAILQHALDQANRVLRLSFLAEAMPQDKAGEALVRLKSEQDKILTQASPFIPAVLKEQDERFHQVKDLNSRCQQIPWDQVIPLYDRGFRLAQSVKMQYQQAAFDFQAVMAGQIQTIKEWEQALNLILHPPQQGGGATTQQKWGETFRKIQEMYLEDQSPPKHVEKELHSW